jgi:hypothetical protein
MNQLEIEKYPSGGRSRLWYAYRAFSEKKVLGLDERYFCSWVK